MRVIDVLSRYKRMYFLDETSQAIIHIKKTYIRQFQRQTGQCVNILRADRGRGFQSIAVLGNVEVELLRLILLIGVNGGSL